MYKDPVLNSLHQEALKVDLRRYVEGLGYSPKHISGNKWYLNCWWDGDTENRLCVQSNRWCYMKTGKGGDIVDLAKIVYNSQDDKKVLQMILASVPGLNTTPIPVQTESEEDEETQIHGVRPIKTDAMRNYIGNRGISPQTANKFVSEVFFNTKTRIKEGKLKDLFGIGFKNDDGGWEIRSEVMKRSIKPKSITTKRFSDSGEWVVFEGFFDFLSYWERYKDLETELKKRNYLILNSTSCTEKALLFLERENTKTIFLILDNDKSGDEATARFFAKFGNLAQDKRNVLNGCNDYNDYLKSLNVK